ncbi:restriction endonuclease subunit S [Nitrogeniibacter mangrovi]|uniref:Restriction endonuclease subunit S n=1 Tax=Nitrogeniibacter mangrovi TaxID=2016596 RepID=A0A6C1B4N9_9RHOO|nr:restriction endonuclease subunit S [Nitrogeniibacter mangrovi]QID17835.1 restriction endonuclease subunit S [Nitrogeniibacter mangrovi]
MSVVLSEHLPLLASAPDGIQKLRGLILDLAVRGKLVSQDPASDPEFTTLGAIGRWAVGSGFPKSEQGIKGEEILFAKVSDMNLPENGRFITTTNNTISRASAARLRVNVHPAGTVIFPKIGGAIATNKRRLLIHDTAIDNNCLGLTPHSDVVPDWLFVLLASIDFTKYQAGTSIPALAQGVLAEIPVRVPSIVEQHRIVAKVDELMALCDRLEAEQTDANAAHAQLVDTLLGTLTQSADATELAANWQRLASHFDTLFTTEAAIDALKQTVLQLAVMGKLVPQDPKDEPASALFDRIEKERVRLVAEGRIKQSKPVPPVAECKRPFREPDGWIWTRWVEVAQKIGDIDHKMPETVEDGIPYVSPRDFYPDNRIDFAGAKKVSRDDFVKLSAKIRPELGDIIYPRYGTIGENRLVVDDIEFLASYSCCVIKTMIGFVSEKYQFYFSISQVCRDQARAAENKTTQANVGIKSIQLFAFPLPPLAEQHRIVAKVDELMALCDRLKADLSESREQEARLATSLIDAALMAA